MSEVYHKGYRLSSIRMLAAGWTLLKSLLASVITFPKSLKLAGGAVTMEKK
jgi:hypothetical protein